MNNILVLGGSGFIGSNFVDELMKDSNNHVTVIDNFSVEGTKNNLTHLNGNPRFKLIEGDIRDKELMLKMTKNMDYVYNFAVQCVRVSLYDQDLVHEVNATGTLNLCTACLKNNVKKFIYISSSEIYGTAKTVPMNEDHPTEPTTAYGASKLAGELYTKAFYRAHGLPCVIIRPFNTYGPREHFEGPYGEVIPRFAIKIKNGKSPTIFGDGKQTRDFTDIRDTVKGILLASQNEEIIGEVVNIANGKEVSVNEIANILLEELGSDLKPEYAAPRPGDVLRHYADISKARKLLNFEPKHDIRSGIKFYLDWLEKQDIDVKKLQNINWVKDAD